MKRRMASLLTVLALCLALLPVTALAAVPDANTWWMNGHPEERTGTATPASPTGATPAVPYRFTARPLTAEGSADCVFSNAISYHETYEPIAGVTDYGEVEINPTTSPYVVYTPSDQVANQTVTIYIWAENADGRCETPLVLTVKVGPQPTETSANASLSGLSYQVEGGEAVLIEGFNPSIPTYAVALPDGTELGKTITLTGVPEDGKAKITASQEAVTGYTPSQAGITVTAENGITEKTYTVTFTVEPPDTPAGVFAGDTLLDDGDYLQVSTGQATELTISLGAGGTGYDRCTYSVDDSGFAEVSGSFAGSYPDITAACSITAKQAGTAILTAAFYREGEQGPAWTVKITLGTDPDPATHAAVTFDENYSGGGTCTVWTEKGSALPSWPGDPVRSGYTFRGWYTDQEAGTLVEATETFTQNTTLYAHWEMKTEAVPYNITYELDGGAINSGEITSYTYGTGAALPTDVTKDNYKFGGWYDNPDCLGEAVTAVSPDEAGDKTFYAKWWTTKPYYLWFEYNVPACGTPQFSFTYEEQENVPTCYCAPGTVVTVTITLTPQEGYQFDELRFLDTEQNDITDRVQLKAVEGQEMTWTFVMQEPELYINPVCTEIPTAPPQPFVGIRAGVKEITYGDSSYVLFNADVADETGAELKVGTVQFYRADSQGDEPLGEPGLSRGSIPRFFMTDSPTPSPRSAGSRRRRRRAPA